MSDELPLVSVVVPMLNERAHIEECLAGFARQTYPLDRLDVVVVDGGSDDGSREMVEKLAAERPWMRVVDNPKRRAAAAFNVGVGAARGDVVCLFSSHGVPHDRYIEASVEALRGSDAAGVGGRYLHVGTTRVSNAVGLAMISPFGMASPHRFVSVRREVDTISHPAYWRSRLLEVGPFDESLERNSDYDMNWRLREAGMRLVFDPSIESVYRPRPSLRLLARQFWWYGRWKARVIRRHPPSLRARHLVPPAAAAVGMLSPVVALHPAGRRSLGRMAIAYVIAVFVATLAARPQDHDADPLALAACFPVMHGAWGAGFLLSAFEDNLR